MDKVAIGYLRILAYLLLVVFFDLPSLEEIKFTVSDWYYGGHTSELRKSFPVQFTMLMILAMSSFLILQTIVYIFIGDALQGFNTSPFNLLRHIFRSIREIGNDKYFWTSDRTNSNFRNIDDLLRYRDNKMALMNNAQAAEIIKKTSHIDMLRNSSDLPQSKKALSYLNNKIALMDNETALKYIQNSQ